jgi:hypothetical protein
MQFIGRNEPVVTSKAVEPEWRFTASVYLRRHHCLLYRDDHLGIQKQVMTRRKPVFFLPSERSYYFVDGVSTVFRSEERMLRAWKRLTEQRSSASSR